MRKSVIVIICIVVVLFGIFFWYTGTYNNIVKTDEAVTSQWGNVENQYQRRSDLIPNLVATVKGYATHEENTLKEVVEARAKATQISIDPTKLNEQSLAQYQEAQGKLSSTLSRLLMNVEAYPDLKANQNFQDLQAQLEGTENRISTERTRFNEQARNYNIMIKKFPNNLVANMSGFTEKPYFKAEAGSAKAPQVKF